MRRITAIIAALLVIAGCSNDNAQPANNSDSMRVALLTPGPVVDQAWNGGAYNGLLAIRDSLGARVSHVQTRTPAEFDENLRQYGEQGYSLVIANGFEYQDAVTRVAPEYPKTVYVVTSGRVVGPNVAGIAFAFEEASYQAGIVAGTMTKSNVIGMIGGQELPPVRASFIAFERGAKSVNPRATVLTSYIGNWDDASAGKEQALAQISRGADIIFQNADAAGLGIFQAARERNVYIFGSNSNQNDVAPEVVLGSIVIDWPRTLIEVAREVQSGRFDGRVIVLGVTDDYVTLVPNPRLADRIPASATQASDSVARLLRENRFHALDDVLAGADTAIRITPRK